MANTAQVSTSIFSNSLRAAAYALITVLALFGMPFAHGQTFTVLHTFTGGAAGSNPTGRLTTDSGGNLYGTATNITYKLSRRDGWTLIPLRTYTGGPDGYNPWGGVIFGPDGRLYGSTWLGGFGGTNCAGGCGVLFALTPDAAAPRSVLSPWNETVIYAFLGTPNDGQNPGFGNLLFDGTDIAYGTTEFGGPSYNGTIFKLTRSGGTWRETVLHDFLGSDGALPLYTPVLDAAGNLYGTTDLGGTNEWGTVWELSPSGGGYTLTVLHNFIGPGDGAGPVGLIRDAAGNLYGTTQGNGQEGGGNIFELTYANGAWNFNVLYSFYGAPYEGPSALLTMDSARNLYGTTTGTGSYGYGVVFELSPSGNGWTYTQLHEFTGRADGGEPRSQLVLDSSGNIYGTAYLGGDVSTCNGNGCGVVWEITR